MTTTMRNGVDTEALFGALDAVKAQPEAAKFQFRATNTWVSGTHSRGTIDGFFGLGAEQTHVESHTFDADHPRQLVGTDAGPTPAEYLLHALAACITAGIGNIAAARGVELRRVESTVTGDIDLQGLLGLDDSVRNGFQQIEMRVTIEGDATADELRRVVERSMARSAVLDVLTNGTSVTVSVEG
jgi:uncharacterized OsmC-like protein